MISDIFQTGVLRHFTTDVYKYKQAYEQVTISDEDIEYLHNTLSGALEILNAFSPQDKKNTLAMQTMIQLLNKDTLKTMQLLGFNYREAIGQPLTEVCSETIKNKLGKKSPKGNNKNRK